MKEFSIDTQWLLMLLEGAQASGLDCQKLLLEQGISSISLKQQNTRMPEHATRVPLEAFAAFAGESMQAMDDEFFGLADKPQRVGSFAMMCRSSISARTIGRSMKRAANFWNLFNNTYLHSLNIIDDSASYTLTLIDGKKPLNNYLVSAILSSVHRFHCWLGGQFISIDQVSLEHSKPSYHKEYQSLYYGAPTIFNQPCSSIQFSARLLDGEISQTPETLDEYLHGTNLSLLYQPKNYRVISDQVRQWLERNIKQGNYNATLKEAAKHFKLSQQVMHRRLMSESLSFKEIKMQTRRDMAVNLLFAGEYKIEEIAIMVGFSEPSAFIRAFKSWTGMTPRNYRHSQKNPQTSYFGH